MSEHQFDFPMSRRELLLAKEALGALMLDFGDDAEDAGVLWQRINEFLES